MATTLDQLFSGLQTAISRDPLPAPAVSIVLTPLGGSVPSSYWVRIENDRLTGTVQSAQTNGAPLDPVGTIYQHRNLDIDLFDIGTLQDLCNAINVYPGFSATVVSTANAKQKATALIEGVQDIASIPILNVYTSLLWALLRPIASLMRRAYLEGVEGLSEVSPQKAEGMWLSSIGDLYGFDRVNTETDEQYRQRLLFEVIRPRCNNIAIEEYLKWSLQISDVTVTDDPSINFRFLVNLILPPGGGFNIPIARVHSIVQSIKAWGTIWVVNLIGKDTDMVNITSMVQTAVRYVLPYQDLHTMINTKEKYAAKLTQYYTESFRTPGLTLWTGIWKDGGTGHFGTTLYGTGTILSDTGDKNVVTMSKNITYRSWVEHIIDMWSQYNPQKHDNGLYDVTRIVERIAFKLGIIEDATGMKRHIRESYYTSLAQRVTEQRWARWRVFKTGVRYCITGDTNSLVGAQPASAAGGANAAIGDPSWIIRH